MEINDYRPRQNKIHKAASEYEASQVKAQQIKESNHNQKPIHFNKNEQTIIKGEIIDLRYHEVKIRLEPSGQIVSAKLSGELPLSIGQTAEFTISDQTDGLITLRYIPTGNTPIDDLIQKALYVSGYTASERNVAIVQELLNYQMPVDKNTILQLIKLTSTYPEVDVSTLVLMHKNGLPINIASIAQFEAYNRGAHQILNQLKSLIYQINDVGTNDLISKSDDKKTNDIISTMNIADTHIDEANIKGSTTNIVDSDSGQKGDLQPNNPNPNNLFNIQRELLALLIDEPSVHEQTYPDTSIRQIFSDNELTELQNTLIIEINESVHYNDEMAEIIKHQLLDGSLTIENLMIITNDIYGGQASPPFSDSTTLALNMAKAFIDMSQFLSDSSIDKLVNLMRSDNYRDIITEALHMRWTINPKELTLNNKVKEFFSRLDKDMEGLDKMVGSLSMSHQEIKALVNKVQDNLQFMKDLNELFIYLQLPMRLTEQDIHGDLYVFTHKNHKPKDRERLNVLLHLDMANLGSMDIHMSMMGHQINAIFYIEESSEKILSEHLHELINSLWDKGYQFHAKMQISASKPDFINDILQQDAPNSNTHRYSFDIRA